MRHWNARSSQVPEANKDLSVSFFISARLASMPTVEAPPGEKVLCTGSLPQWFADIYLLILLASVGGRICTVAQTQRHLNQGCKRRFGQET